MDKKISELDQAIQINNDAVFPISQDNGGTDTTYKVSITQISAEIGEDQTFSNLDTTDKTLVGAINEVAQGGGGGGSSTLEGLTDVDIDDQTLSDGQVLKYDSVEEKWVNDDVGAGGHTIVADDGTDLTQRAKLQFKGAYSEDNSVDDTTEVNVVRNMTRAQFNQLSADEKTGLINISDESLNATEIPMSSAQPISMVADRITDLETSVSGKQNTLTVEKDTYNIATYGGQVVCRRYGNTVSIICSNFGLTQAPATGAAYTLTTIASKYCPDINLRVIGAANYSSYKYDSAQGYAVNTDGTIVTYNNGTPAITNGNFEVTFIKD